MDQVIISASIKRDEGDIFVKPICDLFKIDYENQLKRIKKDPLLSKLASKKTATLQFGDNFERICLPERGFFRWVQLINPTLVQEDIRVHFLDFQINLFDYFFNKAVISHTEQIQYTRLKKMERLYGLIGREIQSLKKKVDSSIDKRFSIQYSLQKELDGSFE